MEPDGLRKVAFRAIDISEPEQRIGPVRINDQGPLKQTHRIGCTLGHEGVRAIPVERVHFLFTADEAIGAPIHEDVGGFFDRHDQCNQRGAQGHRE